MLVHAFFRVLCLHTEILLDYWHPSTASPRFSLHSSLPPFYSSLRCSTLFSRCSPRRHFPSLLVRLLLLDRLPRCPSLFLSPRPQATGLILVQVRPANLKSALDRCRREVSAVDGVLECNEEHYWTQSPGVIVGSIHVRAPVVPIGVVLALLAAGARVPGSRACLLFCLYA